MTVPRYTVGGAGWSPAGCVDLRASVTFACADASGGQIRPGVATAGIDPGRLFPVYGPVFVEGIAAGDWVGVKVAGIEPTDSHGHVWTRPGLGVRPPQALSVRAVDLSSLRVDWAPWGRKLVLQRHHHVGTLGVFPRSEHVGRDVGDYGGNIDFAKVGAGSTVWLRAQVDGGGIFMGDVHAAIGDGEVCGTGVEVAARVGVSFSRRQGKFGMLPRVERGRRVWVIGHGKSLDAAVAAGLEEVCAAVSRVGQMKSEDAYLASSLLLEIGVCQMVNPSATVAMSLRQGLDRWLLPWAGKEQAK